MPASPVQLWDPLGKPHRRIARAGTKPRKGKDIRNFQKAVNAFANAHPRLKITKLKHDGIGNRQTIAMGRLASELNGVDPGGKVSYGISVYAQQRLINPDLRTAHEKARALKAQGARRKELDRIEAAKRAPKISLDPDRVTGGKDFGDRAAAALLAATERYKQRPGDYFYSQGGAPDWDHPISAPTRGHRYDCSSFSAGIARACGQDWLRGGGYFTGTAAAIGTPCSLANLRPGGYIVYGSGNGHHMEMYYGDGEHTFAEALRLHGRAIAGRTVGHGSPPVDFGDVSMMAAGRYFNPPTA